MSAKAKVGNAQLAIRINIPVIIVILIVSILRLLLL